MSLDVKSVVASYVAVVKIPCHLELWPFLKNAYCFSHGKQVFLIILNGKYSDMESTWRTINAIATSYRQVRKCIQ